MTADTDRTTSELQSLLERTVGGASIGANLAKAVARGTVLAHDDGTWSLKTAPLMVENWVFGSNSLSFPCAKLMGFLFYAAYDRRAVPHGCRTCFKVQIKPSSLRELHAARAIAETLPYPFKAGATLNARYQSGPYATLFYLSGLEEARQAYAEIAKRMEQEQLNLPLTIKRGCTEYEVFCGPSDKFTFAPDLPEIETDLIARLRPIPKEFQNKLPKEIVFMRWIQVSYQIGDETYRDYTGDRRLYPAIVTY